MTMDNKKSVEELMAKADRYRKSAGAWLSATADAKMECEKLRIENGTLRAALVKAGEVLEPFAVAASMIASGFPDHDIMPMRLGQCRDAQAALTEIRKLTGENDE